MDLKAIPRKLVLVVACLTLAGGLWPASQWWEKGLAESVGEPLISPGGCYRVEEFKPFWVLPSLFHLVPDPNKVRPPQWHGPWNYPGFYRLYDNRSGEFLGETDIYDLEFVGGGGMLWGDGTEEVSIGIITLGPNVADCPSDHPVKQKSK